MATHLVIDADGHCNEPNVGLVKWVPKEYAHLAPIGFKPEDLPAM